MESDAHPSDRALLRRAHGGDAAAFEALVKRHFGLVYTIALSRMRDAEIAEDLAQEVMLRAFLHLKQLRPDGSFSVWVAQITRNLATDWHRRGQRASRLLTMVPLDEAHLNTLRASGKGPRETMASEQEAQALRDVIFNLPEDQRDLVLLHHAEGLSQSEIAERLAITQATVSRRLIRIPLVADHPVAPEKERGHLAAIVISHDEIKFHPV